MAIGSLDMRRSLSRAEALKERGCGTVGRSTSVGAPLVHSAASRTLGPKSSEVGDRSARQVRRVDDAVPALQEADVDADLSHGGDGTIHRRHIERAFVPEMD